MCPTLTVGNFFRRVRSTFLFICSTTSNLNNSNLKSASKTKRRNKTDVRNLEITLRILHSPTFFRHYATFSKLFDCTKGPPFIFFDILQHNGRQDVKKSQRASPFTFFGTVTVFKNLIFKIFLGNFFKSPKGSPQFFFIFCNQLEFHKARKVPPFTILSLRYTADFGRSRLVSICFRFKPACDGVSNLPREHVHATAHHGAYAYEDEVEGGETPLQLSLHHVAL